MDRKYFNEPGASLFIVLLLAADFSLVLMHSLHSITPLLSDERYSVAKPGGYGEIYQCAKYLWIVLVLAYVMHVTREGGYAAWMLLFTYLLVDDAVEMHERLGAAIADAAGFVPRFRLRALDFGELIVSAAAALLLFVGIAAAFRRGTHAFRKVTRDLLLLVAALGFFGVVVDMAQIAARMGTNIRILLETLEDGGEMAVASFMLWYVFRLAIRSGTRPAAVDPGAYGYVQPPRSS